MNGALTGVSLLIRVYLRTGWKMILAWLAGLSALFAVTAVSMAELNNTPEKIAGYAASVGDSMVVLNGRIAGLDTLGGLVANEFALIVALALPVMAIALVSRGTRKDEEAGRMEVLLSARIGRLAPVATATVIPVVAFTVLGGVVFGVMMPLGIARGAAALYAVSLVVLGWVYVALMTFLAQLVGHNRSLWMVGLASAVALMLCRGIGASRGSWLSWLSPLGWQDQVRSFGDSRWWPLLLSVAAAVLFSAAAAWIAGRRDLGAGLLPSRTGAGTASSLLRTPWGCALRVHLGSIIGWTLGTAVLMATYGSLMKVILDAINNNPALTQFVGAPDNVLDSVAQLLIRFIGFLGAGLCLQSLGALRAEETSGRLEVQLVFGYSRRQWLWAHTGVVAVGALAVVGAGSLAMGATTAMALHDKAYLGQFAAAGLWQLPAVLAFGGLSLALFGAAPRWQVAAWAPFALAVVIAYLGPTLQLTPGQARISPFALVGDAPGGPIISMGVISLLALATVLSVIGTVSFRRRDIPFG